MNNFDFIAFMGPIGLQEMIVIFLIILLLFGAKKIPELARGIGKGMGEFKKAKEDFENEIKAGEDEGKEDWEKPRERPQEKSSASSQSASSTAPASSAASNASNAPAASNASSQSEV